MAAFLTSSTRRPAIQKYIVVGCFFPAGDKHPVISHRVWLAESKDEILQRFAESCIGDVVAAHAWTVDEYLEMVQHICTDDPGPWWENVSAN